MNLNQFICGLSTLCLLSLAGAQAAPQHDYASALLDEAGLENVEFRTVTDLRDEEAYRVLGQNKAPDAKVLIEYEAPAGAIYGAQAVVSGDYVPGQVEAPDFEIRGTTLCLMSGGNSYKSTMSPEIFPWFYDKAFMLKTLDTFADARINTIFVWAGHLFPYIVEMPDYPEASADVPPEQVKLNQEQFRWFTQECEKRNIEILLHFYNIHVSPPFAEHHGIPTAPKVPTDLLRNYTYYALSRYFEEFPSVGLYACPGESIKSDRQLEWFRDVIFKAAKDSGKEPLIVMRDWTLNADFQAALKSLYPRVYSELKHNDESVTSPYPDVRHKKWEGLANGHIVNAAHGPAEDLQPMRWASPSYVQEMARHWKSLGYTTGVEFWGQSYWCWPYTYDKLEDAEPGSVMDAKGRHRLIYLDRDAPFYVLAGRAMWKTDRDPEADSEFWKQYYSERYGSEAIGERMEQWYEISGELSPGIQNLNATKVANFWATLLLMNQNIDQILSYNKDLSETPYTLHRETGRARQRYYPRPFSASLFERYQKEYGDPKDGMHVEMYPEFAPYAERMGIENLAQRHCTPVTQYAKLLASGEPAPTMTPYKLVTLLNTMAKESLALAQEMEALNKNPAHEAELRRFVTDSEMYVLATQAMIHKETAAILKAQMLLAGNKDKVDAFLKEMKASVDIYEELADLTDQTYLFANGLRRYRWSEKGIAEFRKDNKTQKDWADRVSKNDQKDR